MDLLNDNINKAELGAFYTPDLYSKMALEYVREAIKKVPKDMDYIILDRCAGTGNLQKFMTKEELSHVIINTYEVKEWLVLYDKFYDKVRGIIPPAENVKNHRGNLVFGGDALTEEFLTSTIETNYKYKTLQEYIEDESVVIIGLENPPYSEENARNQDKSKNNLDTLFYKNHIKDLMKNSGINGNYTKDLANQFIWSYIYFFMRNKYDSYIVFSPIKYWKSANICNKKFIKGFIANRGNFKASESAICVCYWQNIDDFETNNINLDVLEIRDFDKKYTTGKSDKAIKIPNTATLKKIDNVNVEKVYKTLSEFYSKKLEEDLPSEIALDYKGYEREQYKNKNYGKVVYNKNILGILEASGFGLTAQDVRLVRTALYHGYGSYIRDFNYHEQLPLFVTKNFIKEKWYEDGLYYSTADGGDLYLNDKEFLRKCIIWSCITPKNHCRSFRGKDKNIYRNELCFDEGTLIYKEVYKNKKFGQLDVYDNIIIGVFIKLLNLVKQTDEYKKLKNNFQNITLGTYQIKEEINLFYIDSLGKKIPRYSKINTKIIELEKRLNEYYLDHLKPKLFKYKLIK